MKKVATITLALMLTSASLALAFTGGLNLYVGDCGAGPSSTSSITNACTSNGGSFSLYGSVIVPSALPLFVASGQILDIQTSQGALPSWWDFAVCRAGAIAGNFGGAAGGLGNGACGGATIWDGQAAPTGFTGVQPGVNGAARMRINSGAAVGASFSLGADGTTELGVINYQIFKTSSTGSTCPGCSFGACLVLNEINLQQSDNTVTVITNAIGSNHVTYNGTDAGTPVCPDGVPTRNRTWGAVKALYR